MKRDISDKELQLEALDGLRGFAALIVILSHTSSLSMYFLPYIDARGIGKSGVFLFFLLSSFLLSRALIKRGTTAFSFNSLNGYSQRRFFRIYPLYIPYLLLGLLSTPILSNLLGKENMGLPFSLNIGEFFEQLLLIKGKGLTWSIAVEFKFYFVLPFIIFMIHIIRSKLGLIAELLSLIFLIALTQVISPQDDSLVNDARLLPYMCIFLFGTLLAVLQCEIESHRVNKESIKFLIPIGYLSIAFLLFMTPTVASFLLGDVPKNIFHRSLIQYTLLWSFVLLSVVNFDTKLSRFFKSKIMCFYGSLSFSIYLFHPIFIKVANFLELNIYLAAWFVLIASTITSYFSFKVLELPASKISYSYSKSKRSNAA